MNEQMLQKLIEDHKPRARDRMFQKENARASDVFRLLGRTFDNLDIELRICSTYARESSLLKVGAKQYLLYDEYLTETLNALNLLYYRCSRIRDIEKFVCRMLADQFFVYGKYDAALYMIREYARRNSYSDDMETDMEMERSAIGCAVIQQWFIIAHEMGHWFIGGHGRKKQILSDKKDFLMEIFSHGSWGTTKESFQRYIMTKEIISEECFCDSTSVMLVMDALKDRYQMEQIAEACFLAMEHIRILAGIEMFSRIKGDTDFAMQATIRLAHLRFVLSELVKDSMGKEEGSRIFKQLGDIFKEYDRVLYHPAVGLLQSVGKDSARYAGCHQNLLSGTEIEPILEKLV